MKVEWINGMPSEEGKFWIANNCGWVGLCDVELLDGGDALTRDGNDAIIVEKHEFNNHWHFPAEVPEPPEFSEKRNTGRAAS